jgi:polysaccharide biosynthesis transport protein
MEPLDREMTLRDYWRVIVRRRWLVIAATVITVVAAVSVSLLQTPIYSSTAEILVQPRTAGGLFQNQTGTAGSTNARAVQTEIQVLEGEVVRQRVQDRLGLAERPPEISASAVGDTDVIRLSARHTDPDAAQAIANAYAASYIEVRREQSVDELLAASAEVQAKIDELQVQLDALADDDPTGGVLRSQQATFRQTLDQLQVDAALRTGGASIIRSAESPAAPVEPTPSRTAALALVVGLLIGLGAAFLVDYVDDSIEHDDDLEGLTDRPVLAVVPVDPPPDHRPVSVSRPDDYAVETYRGLRTNLQFLALDRPIKVVQVTSSLAGEGKTTTATNLAVVLAQSGRRVLVLDADLRRPRIHEVFDVPPSPGLTDLLLGTEPDDVITTTSIGEHDRIDVVTAGSPPPNPSEMLSNQRTARLLAELGERYDYVVVDSAPVLPVADSIALAATVDGVILVAQAGRVTGKNVAESLERLGRVSAPVVGMVLNQARKSDSTGYGYGYGYEYSYAASGRAGDRAGRDGDRGASAGRAAASALDPSDMAGGAGDGDPVGERTST